MMAGAKPIDESHKEMGIEETHTWDSITKTCTPIVYSHPVTESDDDLLHWKPAGEEEEEEEV